MSIVKSYRKISSLQKMFFAMAIGIILGIVLGEKVEMIEPIGKFFLTALKMIALPLVIVNLIAGISALDDPKAFGRIGGRIIVYYTVTTGVAMVIGSIVASILKPGVGIVLEGTYDGVAEKVPSVFETIIGLVPKNIFGAMVEGRFDQVVVTCAFIGIGILLLPEEPRVRLSQLFSDLSSLMSAVVGMVMGFAPFGICALIATSVGKYGSAIFGFLAKYIASIYIGVFFMVCLYATLVYIFTKTKPSTFFKGASAIMITAFSTCSSTSSIPVNMECAEKLNVPKKVYNFTIPLGAQINKDGTGLALTIVFILTSQALGLPVDLATMVKVIILGLILTTGSGAIPSGMLVILAIILESFGFPLEIIGLVAGVHAFNDMGMTMINCLGDLAGTVIVGNAEKNRDLKLKEKAEAI